MVPSTNHRRLYRRSFRPSCVGGFFRFFLCGAISSIPFPFRCSLNGLLSYPLLAISLTGLVLGLSGQKFYTLTVSSVFSRSLTSAGGAESRYAPSGVPEPSTSTIHFVPLPRLVFPTLSPLFFAGAKLPSTKDSFHRILSLFCNSLGKARYSSSRTPFSSHSCNRRQQVLGLAYSFGSSLQGTPVQRIHRIPSKHFLSSARRRPPLGRGGEGGRCSFIFSHCASVKCRQLIIPSLKG